MFFQIKAIRKGTKPPIWRRAYIPSNITFAQLALILETILEYDASDMYEFEFYQKKDRIIEWHKGEQYLHDFYYSYLNAPDTYINDWLFNEGWFTFRLLKEDSNAPEYRVEIEKKLESIRIEDCGEMKDLSYPIIFKQVSAENDRFWSDIYAINDTLKNECFTVKSDSETDSDYSYISELRKRIKAGRGIVTSNEMVNRDIHTKKSTNSIIKEFADNVLRPYVFEKAKDISNGIEYDEGTGEIMSPEEAVKKTAEKLMVEMIFGKNQTAKNSIPERTDTSQCTNRRVNASMKGILNAYTKQDLCEIAKELGLQLIASRKDKIVYELTRHLLEPQTMREQLLQLDESELDAFEKAMEKGRFIPSDEEAQELAAVYDLNYIAEFTDNSMEVPEEVKLVYNVIIKNGYREFHQKAYWLIKCLKAFELIHLIAPNRILYRMYKQNKNIKADYDDFMTVLGRIPDSLNPCRMIEDKLVSKETLKNEIYKRIEARQRDIDYYIPTMKEIISYAEDEYPSCEDTYVALYNFFSESMHIENELCESLCIQAFRIVSAGGRISSYIDIVNEMNIAFVSDKQAEQFASLVMQVNNNTRMFELKGHKPLEVRHETSGFPKGKSPVIAPMSAPAAGLLESGKAQFAAMGIEVDTESTATNIPVINYANGLNGKADTSMKKVYPNDPCPCGSGKKYKKCCGRK